jgi:predicted deacylase
MLTDQLAHAIVDTFLPGCDAVIDLHSGGNFATVDYLYLHDLGGELSRAFGAELYYRGSAFSGTLSGEAERRGIPAIVTELGGGQQRNAGYADRGVRGIVNVLRHLKMVPGTPELPAQQRVFTELVTLRPHQGGMLVSEVGVDELGSSVPRGTVLGRILNPLTFAELEVVEAPFEPTILILVREEFTKIDPGDFGFMVANGATAEPL